MTGGAVHHDFTGPLLPSLLLRLSHDMVLILTIGPIQRQAFHSEFFLRAHCAAQQSSLFLLLEQRIMLSYLFRRATEE